MRFEIIQKEDFVVHGWSGGTTAEIFLYPPSSHWEKKDLGEIDFSKPKRKKPKT